MTRWLEERSMERMRVALVHDYLTHFGGAERVLSALMELFPHAPVFTLMYDEDRLGDVIDKRRVRTSWLQRLPGARRYHRYYPLLMPMAVEQFDLRGFDVVLSATHSFGKGVVVSPGTVHISYCFTPTRYVWDNSHRYVREFSRNALFQKFVPLALSYVRMWDYFASARVDAYATISEYVAQRIAKYYGRKATVIYPPVDVERFIPGNGAGDYYLVVARLVPYKRVDWAVEACERLGRPLKVVGAGPELRDLQQRAGKWTEFLGFVPDDELPDLYAGARALLFPQEEDFGITPLEAAAAGRPTVALAAGGALETVREGETGVLFAEQTVEGLMRAMEVCEGQDWNAGRIRSHAEQYGRERFLREMSAFVEQVWHDFQIEYEGTT